MVNCYNDLGRHLEIIIVIEKLTNDGDNGHKWFINDIIIDDSNNN